MQVHSVNIGQDQLAIIELDRDLLGGPETEELRKTFQELAEKGNRNLVLDLRGSSYINSMGLGVLASAYITYRKLAGTIALCNCGPNVRALLGRAKLGLLFEVCGSREEAIKFLSN